VSKGDHIWVWRLGYTRHGLDVGDDIVVHFTGTPGSKRNAAIQKSGSAPEASVHSGVEDGAT